MKTLLHIFLITILIGNIVAIQAKAQDLRSNSQNDCPNCNSNTVSSAHILALSVESLMALSLLHSSKSDIRNSKAKILMLESEYKKLSANLPQNNESQIQSKNEKLEKVLKQIAIEKANYDKILNSTAHKVIRQFKNTVGIALGLDALRVAYNLFYEQQASLPLDLIIKIEEQLNNK